MTPVRMVLVAILFCVGIATVLNALSITDPSRLANCADASIAPVSRDRPLEPLADRQQRATGQCQRAEALLSHPMHGLLALLSFGGGMLLMHTSRKSRRRADVANLDHAIQAGTIRIPELNLTGTVADPGGAVWWIDVPAVGPSRLVGTWPAAEAMHVLVGIAGSWTVDLGIHAGGCDEQVQLPSPRACICVASTTVRDATTAPIDVRMTVDLPGEQADARLVA